MPEIESRYGQTRGSVIHVQAVARACAILRAVDDNPGVSNATLAKLLGMHKSTISRIIQTLVSEGIVAVVKRDDGDARYKGAPTEYRVILRETVRQVCPHEPPADQMSDRMVDECDFYLASHPEATKVTISRGNVLKLLEAARFARKHSCG
jgi:DNA-binding Lrp family transcriptional regulator